MLDFNTGRLSLIELNFSGLRGSHLRFCSFKHAGYRRGFCCSVAEKFALPSNGPWWRVTQETGQVMSNMWTTQTATDAASPASTTSTRTGMPRSTAASSGSFRWGNPTWPTSSRCSTGCSSSGPTAGTHMRCSPPTPPGTPSQFGISTLRREPRPRDASEK